MKYYIGTRFTCHWILNRFQEMPYSKYYFYIHKARKKEKSNQL